MLLMWLWLSGRVSPHSNCMFLLDDFIPYLHFESNMDKSIIDVQVEVHTIHNTKHKVVFKSFICSETPSIQNETATVELHHKRAPGFYSSVLKRCVQADCNMIDLIQDNSIKAHLR